MKELKAALNLEELKLKGTLDDTNESFGNLGLCRIKKINATSTASPPCPDSSCISLYQVQGAPGI